MKLHPDVTDFRAIANFETLEQRFIETHGENTHDYSKFIFYNSKEKSTIICLSCGEPFEMNAANHLRGNSCNPCGFKKMIKKKIAKRGKTIVAELEEKHPTKLGFDRFIFKGMKFKSWFYCNHHEIYFESVVNYVLQNKFPCSLCADESVSKIRNAKVKKDFISRSISIFGKGVWGYGKVEYTTFYEYVTLWCFGCGDYIQQKASSHLTGRGCRYCNRAGFDDNKSGYLYYLRVQVGDIVAYKIGITNKSVKERYSKAEIKTFTLLNLSYFEKGFDCRMMESKILKMFKQYKYIGDPLLVKGNTELFNKDIFGLDK